MYLFWQCWGIIYFILSILDKYRIIIIIRRLQYLFIHIIRTIAGNGGIIISSARFRLRWIFRLCVYYCGATIM